MSKQQDKDTETLILEVAEAEFLSKGFIGARTTSIAQAAGVTHAMLHYYFRTKENLFKRIIANKIALLKESVIDPIGNVDAPLSEIIRNLINNYLDLLAANPEMPRFLIGEISSNPERTSQLLDGIGKIATTLITILQTKIDNGVSQGICRHVDAKMLILDIISLNVFAFMAAPAVNAALDNCMNDMNTFVEQRKRENYDTIMRKLKP